MGERAPGALRDELGAVGASYQAQRVAGDAEPELDLRADRHPLDVATEGVAQEIVAFVLPVEAHLVAEEAGGDADPDRPFGLGRGWMREGIRHGMSGRGGALGEDTIPALEMAGD